MIREACFVPSRGSRDSVPPASRSRRIDVWSAIVNDARREMFARVPTPSVCPNLKESFLILDIKNYHVDNTESNLAENMSTTVD